MSNYQKSQPSELEEAPQAQTVSAGLVGEQVPQAEKEVAAIASSSIPVLSETTMEISAGSVSEEIHKAEEEEELTVSESFSSTPPIQNTTMELPATVNQPPQSPQIAFSSFSAMESNPQNEDNFGSQNHQQAVRVCHQHTPAYPASLQQDAIALVPYLLLKYWLKQPAIKAEMLNYITPNHHHYFSVIFRRARACMQLLFGINAEEVDPTFHTYVLSTAAGLTYDGIMSDVQGLPKTGLLIIVLSIIFMEGNRAREEFVWRALSMMEVYAGREHCLFGDPRKLVMEDFIQQGYLEYQQVPGSVPACYEFLWGPKARAETTKMKVLQHCAQFGGVDPVSFSALYEEALRDEEENAHP
ncbi:melanoma-associated antigen 2-like [Perognathus longimembris pacificus]|uniref:melanoma-associated antigen 2-like n=1 Tax=Perognathus longimembris pacificus TaxID=214514 RepID=UPI002018ACDC|nr:melanoma-associated antigen 2-like [Perognathus longimembris pacificus]